MRQRKQFRLSGKSEERHLVQNVEWFAEGNCQLNSCYFPARIYLFKVNNRNTRTRCQICSKLTIKHQNDATGVVLVLYC